jgi:hypothetical protein
MCGSQGRADFFADSLHDRVPEHLLDNLGPRRRTDERGPHEHFENGISEHVIVLYAGLSRGETPVLGKFHNNVSEIIVKA